MKVEIILSRGGGGWYFFIDSVTGKKLMRVWEPAGFYDTKDACLRRAKFLCKKMNLDIWNIVESRGKKQCRR